ncbi:hypothetical protein LZG00_03885 [Rhodobacteraceae bacterium LMO-12]|nr:hypothetical protein [Rhodobacteraceae bacterium LMO-JJ12]
MQLPDPVKTIYLATFAIIALVTFAVFGELLPGGRKHDTPRSFGQVVQTFIDNVSGHFSGSEILMGHRKWNGTIEDDKLSFHGMAFTFTDRNDPDTYVPYAFEFDGTAFTPAPDAHAIEIADFFARYKAPFANAPAQTPDDCITPNPQGVDATELEPSIICRLPSLLPDRRAAVIGVLRPDPSTLQRGDGDRLCRDEVQRWLKRAEFKGLEVALCVITDQTFQADSYGPGNWMDIIFYQKRGTRLLNMRGETRNFQRI